MIGLHGSGVMAVQHLDLVTFDIKSHLFPNERKSKIKYKALKMIAHETLFYAIAMKYDDTDEDKPVSALVSLVFDRESGEYNEEQLLKEGIP